MKKLLAMCLLLGATYTQASVQINGAGATFPYPLYSKWIAEYAKKNPKVQINYQSLGSGAGIKQLLALTVDFGASDVPMNEKELTEAKEKLGGVIHLPSAVGAVVVAYNVPGLTGELKLDAVTTANIFSGKITKWDDAAIKALNPKLKLPSKDILVVYRADSSGTTGVFTEYLTKADASGWGTTIKSGKTVKWPVGVGAKGNEGVTATLSQTEGSVAYIEYSYAVENKLKSASLKNSSNEFIAPSFASIAKAAQGAKEITEDILDVKTKGAYPISSKTYIILPVSKKGTENFKEVVNFLSWGYKDGEAFAKTLNYVPVPKNLQALSLKLVK